ncbi:MAG: hypothetical protein MJY91_00475 [Bacteroidales bacterium]|nr:hypothetical protein [Candidatus Cryptobacteroides choladohippi]MCQ2178567.1 hypothetical protein [Bacteroidales bacterium]
MKTNPTKTGRAIYESPTVEIAEMISSTVVCASPFEDNTVKDYDFSDRDLW